MSLQFLLQPIQESLHVNLRVLRKKTEKLFEKAIEGEVSLDEITEAQTEIMNCKNEHTQLIDSLKRCIETLSTLENDYETERIENEVMIYIYAYLLETKPIAAEWLAKSHPELINVIFKSSGEDRLIHEIIDLHNHDFGVQWCKDHRASLRSIGVATEEKLQLQYYLSILKDDRQRAAAYAQKVLPKFRWFSKEEIRSFAGCLYDETRVTEFQKGKYVVERKELKEVFKHVNGMTGTDKLIEIITLGLTAFRTNACGVEYVDGCPSCSLSNIPDSIPHLMMSTSKLDPELVLTPQNKVVELNTLRKRTAKKLVNEGKVVIRVNNKDTIVEDRFLRRIFSL